MMNFEELNSAVIKLAETEICGATEVTAEALGLDRRAAHTLFVGEDWIAVELNQDRTLQYYGGFEYEKNYRTELGGYAFYSTESSRVANHVDRLKEDESKEEGDEDDNG
jgi:hypothetical protein